MSKLYIVTGWSGLIGNQLVKDLVRQKKRVCLVEFKGRAGKRIFKDVRYVKDTELSEISGISENSIFVHAASNANAGDCNKNPLGAVASNINLTVQVLDLCTQLSIKEFLFLSTGFLYGDNMNVAHKEKDKVFAQNTYLATKLLSEKIIESYSASHALKTVIVRLGNVFSAASSEKTIIGKIIKQVKEDRKEIILNSLEPSRDFIYVKDVSHAIQVISAKGLVSACEVLNVSSGKATSVRSLAEKICGIKGCVLPIKEEDSKSIKKYSNILMDITKIKKNYGWQPKYSLIGALSEMMSQTNE